MTEDATPPVPAAGAGPAVPLLTGPLWGFHAICLAVTLPWLWLASTPGYPMSWYGLALVVLLLAAVWVLWVIVYVAQQRRFSRWLFVAPMGGLLVLVAFMTDAPLKARWALSASAFDEAMAAARDLAPRNEYGYFDEPVKVGSYWISGVNTEHGSTTFEEKSGNLCVTASFVNAPNGVPESEATRVVSLGDPWYAVDVGC